MRLIGLAIGAVLVAVVASCGSDTTSNTARTTTSGATTSSAPHTATCDAAVMLPVVRGQLTSAGVEVIRVDVLDCRNGYARVGAVPDNSRCRPDGSGSCYDTEQAFLKSVGSSWEYLTSGPGIDCAHDSDLRPELEAACVALGLRTP